MVQFLFQTEAEGTHGTHKFDKPWALNLSMFSGMTLCIPWYVDGGGDDDVILKGLLQQV